MVLEEHFTEFTRRDWERKTPAGSTRVALVGVGGFVRERALPAIADGEYCEATMLVSGSPDRAVPVADAYGIDIVLDYDAFRAGEHVEAYDAVYVATPNALHEEYALTGAAHGKHVICEKPLATDVETARSITAACADANVTLMTAYRLQVEPAIRRTRELVGDGVVGEVVQAHGGFSTRLLETAGSDTWRLNPALSGGGALVDLGVYPLNTIRFLLDNDPAGVYATTHSSGTPFADVDEHVAFQLEFPTGTTASCTASFDAHANSQLQLVGTDGMVSIDSPFGGVVPHHVVLESGDLRAEYTGPPVDEVREEFDYFGYCVLTGTEPEPDGADAIVDLQAIEAAYESTESGQRVAIPGTVDE